MISRDEWLKALAEAGLPGIDVDDQEAVTTREFAEMLQVPRNTAAHRLELLVKAGKATQTTKRIVTEYGRSVSAKAYRLL